MSTPSPVSVNVMPFLCSLPLCTPSPRALVELQRTFAKPGGSRLEIKVFRNAQRPANLEDVTATPPSLARPNRDGQDAGTRLTLQVHDTLRELADRWMTFLPDATLWKDRNHVTMPQRAQESRNLLRETAALFFGWQLDHALDPVEDPDEGREPLQRAV